MLNRSMKLLWLLSLSSMLIGCGLLKQEQAFTNVQQEPVKQSEKLSQITQQNSTDLLNKAEHWYENSGKLLDSANSKFNN